MAEPAPIMKYRVRQLNMLYLEAEDRILIEAVDHGDARLNLYLTRRLCRRWLKEIVRLMHRLDAQALLDAGKAKALLEFEHAAAPAGKLQSQPAPSGARDLAVEIKISANRSVYLSRIATAGGHAVFIHTPRSDMHQLIGSLRRLAARAEWEIDDVLDWARPEVAAPAGTIGRAN